MISPTSRMPATVRWLHWLAVLLVALAYLTSESAEDGGGLLWHAFAGWALLVVFVPRLWLHWRHRHAFAVGEAGIPAIVAQIVHGSLLAFLLLQPLLGMLALWGEGEPVPLPFTSWGLASPFGVALGEWPGELHEALGQAFYAVIALHAGAALWHHFVVGDRVLRRMF